MAMIGLSPGLAVAASPTTDSGVTAENAVNTDETAPEATEDNENGDTELATEEPDDSDATANPSEGNAESTNDADDSSIAESAPTPYKVTVSLIDQWTNESRAKVDITKDFQNVTDKLGQPVNNPGNFRSIAKTFLGWSDQPQNDAGILPEGARLFSAEDTVATVFPQGVGADAKLYAVYYSLNKQK